MDDDTLSSFAAITGTATDKAQQYLTLTDGNLEQALELYFTNDGADLEGAPSTVPVPPPQVPSVPSSSSSTRPSRPRQGYHDNRGIVHIDSESESDDSGVESAQRAAATPARGQPDVNTGSLQQAPIASTPSAGRTDPGEDDEAMARRLQEEFYGAHAASETTDPEGVRAPIARTTETLVGPGAYDLDDEGDMRAAVLEQMRARQQPPRPRGTSSFTTVRLC